MEKLHIAVAQGDGIGPEIMQAVINIFNAAEVPLEYHFIDMGKSIYEKGFSTGMTNEARETVEKLGILFKGPMETPKGKGVKSINVTARKLWNTYANKRQFRTLNGVETVFSKAGIPIDLTIVRENIEDTYGGIESMLTPDVALCKRLISKPGSMQVCRFAFEMARKEGYKKVACGHKANIMKLTDGLFLEAFYEVAKDYPEIQAYDVIVDDLCMKLTMKPQDFEVVVLTNLQGDIVSDLCAGLVGGLGFAPSANIGDNISIFEAVHGTAPDIAGKNIANPTSLLISGVMMLNHLNLMEHGKKIMNSLLYTLETGVHTGDFGDKSIAAVNTTEFANAIIANLGKEPVKGGVKLKDAENKPFLAPVKPSVQKVMNTPFTETEEVVGMDIFVDADHNANYIAEKIKTHLTPDMNLITITNRGTQVWPEGSIFTECVDQYSVRIEKRAGVELTAGEIFDFSALISKDLKVLSVDVLKNFGTKKGYSLAQGQ